MHEAEGPLSYCGACFYVDEVCKAEGVAHVRELDVRATIEDDNALPAGMILADVRRALEACYPERAPQILSRLRVVTTTVL